MVRWEDPLESDVQRGEIMALVEEVVSPLPCFGNVSFYSALLTKDLIVDIQEHYVKQSLRNRFELCGAQGRFFLTVPVIGQAGQKMPVRDIKISYHQNWQHQHIHAIRSNYGSAPYFEHYVDQLMTAYSTQPIFLKDFAIATHESICACLDVAPGMRLSADYIQSTIGLDLRGDFKSGDGIHPPYIQVFDDRNPFESDLSVVDLIFCKGPESAHYLRMLS